ncbi:MAG: enoyl-CoA hydratase-related protein, partial [Pseudomonadota bacterium]|nr:enoyl-CoA hydratase-related protein [Pseudomonadota bacterium]
MSEFSRITYEVSEGVARIALNRVEVRNAQDKAMLYELNDAFDLASRDDEVKVIVLAANGPHFSS